MPVKSHDTSAHPRRAMNQALIWPLRSVTQASAWDTSHQIATTMSAAGTTAGARHNARPNADRDGPCDHIRIAPLTVTPIETSAAIRRTAEVIKARIVDSGVLRSAQYTAAVSALPTSSHAVMIAS